MVQPVPRSTRSKRSLKEPEGDDDSWDSDPADSEDEDVNPSDTGTARKRKAPGGGGAGGGAGGLARQGSIERSLDIGALTARVVLSMYQAEGNELVLLSELQGSYAFVIYDAAGRHAFAARDPSGAETLFYRIGDDGSAAFASSRAAIPEAAPGDDAAAGPWRELPPGHYISGRSPKLHQYALTPEQLQVRELCEELGPRAAYEKRRSSLDNNGRRGAAADADFDFGMDI